MPYNSLQNFTTNYNIATKSLRHEGSQGFLRLTERLTIHTNFIFQLPDDNH